MQNGCTSCRRSCERENTKPESGANVQWIEIHLNCLRYYSTKADGHSDDCRSFDGRQTEKTHLTHRPNNGTSVQV